MTVVARFLAILELYKEKLIGFEQSQPLSDLTIRWAGGDRNLDFISVEYEEEAPNE
jgi:segregation and condensation protein A